MKLRILVFGIIADIIREPILESNELTSTDGVKAFLQNEYPALQEIRYVISVNKIIVQQNITLKDGDEIALLPPFSGG